ncbi:MAG: hypothetical protein WC515_01910 [Candidatus Omnitrophota bacterium]
MKKSPLIPAVAVLVLLPAVVLAQTEKEGLIPRLWKKLTGNKSSAVSAKTPLTPGKPAAAPQPQPAKIVISDEDAALAPDPGKAELSKEDMIKRISGTLEFEREILSYIPELKTAKDAEGKESISYMVNGKPTPLEELDKEAVKKILIRVNQAANQIRAQNISQQLEVIAQAQRIQATRISTPTTPPAPPKIMQPPAPPPVTPAPVQPPPRPPQIPQATQRR